MNNSHTLYSEAQKYIPGGVNSPVRAFKGVGMEPIFLKKGQGATVIDVDDQAYIDYVCSWGALILGHCHPLVIEAVQEAAQNGMSFGAPTALEIALAKKIIQLMPNLAKVRMVNSGTEATLTAIRLARAYTQKNKIIKFNGCYHGHHDALLVKAGSGLLTLGLPSTAGIPETITQHTLTANYNDLQETEELFKKFGSDIAAVIVEPVAGNMGMVLPQPHFLPHLRTLCDQYKSLLIFDEVITGFRLGLHGAQGHFNIQPDLTTLGKIIGAGMPVGAVGGKGEIMSQLAPEGNVYQAGTLSGNPMAMAAGLTHLSILEKPGFYEQLDQFTALLIQGMNELGQQFKIPFQAKHLGSMFGLYFTDKEEIQNYRDVAAGDEATFRRFFAEMLKEGIYLAPSMYEAGFVSAAHTKEHLKKTLQATEKVFARMSAQD